MRPGRTLVALALVAGLAMAMMTAAAAAPGVAFRGLANDGSGDVDSLLGPRLDSRPIPSLQECGFFADGLVNVKLDCDSTLPNNEPHIAVDPANPLHMVASSNDYDSCCDGFYTTFDGGVTWVQGNMSAESRKVFGSDPVTSFDVKHGTTIHSSLNFKGTGKDGDVVVSISTDGGLNWDPPVEVFDGTLKNSNDKEWIVTDNNPESPYYGRTYVTWSLFRSDDSGTYLESPIWESHSDDGGYTWSPGQEISGSDATYCTWQDDGPAGECDQDQGSVPTIGPDGTVTVAFWNEQNSAAWEAGEQFEEQAMVVRSTDGGATWSSPIHVVDEESGSADYPMNVDDRRTLTGYQLRVNARGNVVASPIDGKLYLTFSDNRAGEHDTGGTPVTDTNVYVMTSSNGTTWTGPVAVSDAAGDQWFPWADVNPQTGQVGVVFNDRGYDLDDDIGYGFTLATGTPSSGFSLTKVTTALSDPVHSAFFQAEAAGCEQCATFHGDYVSIGYGSDGAANIVWTDMRRILNRGLHAQYVYYRRI